MSRSLKHRTTEHRSTIKRNDPTSSGARHSNASNHPATSPAFLGIERWKFGLYPKKKWEEFWICYFFPPEGLNKDFFNLTTFDHLLIYHLPLGTFMEQNITASVTLLTEFIGPWLQSPFQPIHVLSVCVWLTIWFVLWLVLYFYAKMIWSNKVVLLTTSVAGVPACLQDLFCHAATMEGGEVVESSSESLTHQPEAVTAWFWKYFWRQGAR